MIRARPQTNAHDRPATERLEQPHDRHRPECAAARAEARTKIDDAQAVSLRGYEYCRGWSNVSITYTAGFVIQNEAQNVPASGNYSVVVNAPFGAWGADQGVTYANGTALALVASNPAHGQYTVSAGTYGFAAADANFRRDRAPFTGRYPGRREQWRQ